MQRHSYRKMQQKLENITAQRLQTCKYEYCNTFNTLSFTTIFNSLSLLITSLDVFLVN